MSLNMDLIDDSRLYQIGAGILEFNQMDPVTSLLTGYRDMGEVSVIEPTNADERFIKFSNRDRYRAQKANILLRRNTTINIQADYWTATNLGLYFQAKRSAQAAQLGTAVTGEVLTTAAVLGSTYLTAKRGPITGVVVHNTTATTVLVLGTDYEITDTNVGKIRILDTTTAVAAGDDLAIDYTPTAYTVSVGLQLDIGQISIVQGAARFIGDPVNGVRLLFDWWSVEVAPNGALPLITAGNENTPIPLTMTVKSDTTNHPTNPIGRILQLPA